MRGKNEVNKTDEGAKWKWKKERKKMEKNQGNVPFLNSDDVNEYGFVVWALQKVFDCKVFKSLNTEDALLIVFHISILNISKWERSKKELFSDETDEMYEILRCNDEKKHKIKY